MTSGELEGGSGSHSGLSPDWDHDTQTLVLKVCALPGWWVEEQWEHCPGVGVGTMHSWWRWGNSVPQRCVRGWGNGALGVVRRV